MLSRFERKRFTLNGFIIGFHLTVAYASGAIHISIKGVRLEYKAKNVVFLLGLCIKVGKLCERCKDREGIEGVKRFERKIRIQPE